MYRRHHYDVPGLKFKTIEGDHELVKDVEILSAPGHTPGYQVVVVRLPKTGTVVLSPCEHLGMYYSEPIRCANSEAPGIPHTFTWFAAEELRSFKMIRELVNREKGQIFCGHDWEQFMSLKQSPEYYE
jgi:N-acyl homoserine lactone hydrolase